MTERAEDCGHMRTVVRSGDLVGTEVGNPGGERLGKIEDVMIDTATGRVAYAVLSTGGFLGLGDRLFAIPWQIFQVDAARHRFMLDVSKETLKNAPGFDKGEWPDLSLDENGVEVHSYYECSLP